MRTGALISLLLLVGCGSDRQHEDDLRLVTVTDSSPIAHKVAVLDLENSYLRPDQLKPYETVIASLAKRCPDNDEEGVADSAVTAQQRLGGKLIDILRAFDEAVPPNNEGCTEIFAAVAALTSK